MGWIAIAAPVCALLGAVIGGLVSLRINVSTTQHGIADEFSKLSAAQAAQLDSLQAQVGELRERITTLENEAKSWEEKASKWELKFNRAMNYIRLAVYWNDNGRVGQFPVPPDFS